jgi:hypothetical protein
MNARRNRNQILVLGLGLLLLFAFGYLCFELGRYRSGYSLLDQRRQNTANRRLIADERATTEELRRQLAIFETSKEIDRETYSQIEANLGELQAQIQAQEEELVFYRGIVSPQDGVAGLRIQTIEAVPADAERHYLLRLVIVQAIVHSRRVAGVVRLQLQGSRDGQAASFDLQELAAEAKSGSVSKAAADELPFEFRYFQGLESEVVLPVGFEPSTVQIEIWPSEPRGERLTQSFEWSAISG